MTSTRPFRFGAVTPVLTDLATWRDQVGRVADLGVSTLLMPDVQQWQPAPGPTLAVAATVAPQLRVGTWVSATPLRPARSLAWEAHSLTAMTDGRFELGLGTGRPDLDVELRELGLPPVPPAERLARLRDTVTTLRELDGAEQHTPVVMAVRGPKARAVAVELADTITFACPPGDTRADITALAAEVRAACDAELALHVSVVGGTVSPFMGPPDLDTDALYADDSLLVLPTDPAAAIEELLRRREENGFSYVVVGSDSLETLAPVIAELAGR